MVYYWLVEHKTTYFSYIELQKGSKKLRGFFSKPCKTILRYLNLLFHKMYETFKKFIQFPKDMYQLLGFRVGSHLVYQIIFKYYISAKEKKLGIFIEIIFKSMCLK